MAPVTPITRCDGAFPEAVSSATAPSTKRTKLPSMKLFPTATPLRKPDGVAKTNISAKTAAHTNKKDGNTKEKKVPSRSIKKTTRQDMPTDSKAGPNARIDTSSSATRLPAKRKAVRPLLDTQPKKRLVKRSEPQGVPLSPVTPKDLQPPRRSARQPCPRKLSRQESTTDSTQDHNEYGSVDVAKSPPAKAVVPKAPPKTFSEHEFDQIHRQIYNYIKTQPDNTIQTRYKTLLAWANMAINLDIQELHDESANVPRLFARYFQKLCADMTEEDEEYVIAQKGAKQDDLTLVQCLQVLTGRNKYDPRPLEEVEAVLGKGKTPWAGLSAIQDKFDDGQKFFNFENYYPRIQATLDRLALTQDETEQDFLADLVDIIDSISDRCKRRTLFDSKQSAFATYMYIIKATERCIRYQGERWSFSAAVDFTQVAILKLLDPDRMVEQHRRMWMSNASLVNWLYLMGKQSSWHLPNMARVIVQFNVRDDIFAHRKLVAPAHPLPPQQRM